MNMTLLKYTLFTRAFGWLKIPLVGFASPTVERFDDTHCVISIPLGYRTRNHVGSMYFGALAIGAELSIAAAAVFAIKESGKKIDFIFKDFKCEFLKRGDGDVHFFSHEVAEVKALIQKASESKERLEQKFTGYATVPGKSNEPIIKYELTMSVKNRS
ncbi:MAG: DUF4442 domain-containing protein [Bdellovibrionia bacterium]